MPPLEILLRPLFFNFKKSVVYVLHFCGSEMGKPLSVGRMPPVLCVVDRWFSETNRTVSTYGH